MIAGLLSIATLAVSMVGTDLVAVEGQRDNNQKALRVAQVYGPLNQRVSVSFKSAPLAEVVNFLSKQGVSFILQENEFDGARVTLDIQNKPLRDALLALADSVGGHWQRRGEVYVLRKGHGQSDLGGVPLVDVNRILEITEGMLKDGKVEVRPFNREEFMKQWSEGMLKLKDLPVPPEGFMFRDGQMQKLDPEAMKKFQEEIYKRFKDMEIEPGVRIFKDGDFKFPDSEAIRARVDELRAKAQEQGLVVRAARAQDLRKLIDSLTADQLRKQQQQGYLTVEDLTAEQRQLLGTVGNGNWSITYTVDGKTLHLRGK
jgi:hypothetical protein